MAAPPGDDLSPWILRNVVGLGSEKEKAAGSYGAVYEVTVNDVRCIAKRLHAILVNEEVLPQERDSIREKFRQECILLSKLKHPNVVHFVGVHYGQNPGDLSLIMECLDSNLEKFLTRSSIHDQIPLPIKLAILLDVSYGLLYLHNHWPIIIHRDLTASNVLLTKDLRAKIADLGLSKLHHWPRSALVQTKAPGTLYYMPPEALVENPVYDVRLDAFSFGHLSLYTVNQEFPFVFEVPITEQTIQKGTVQLLKRRRAIDKMGEYHCLYPIIVGCLQDLPERRPTTAEFNRKLKQLTEKHPMYGAEHMKIGDTEYEQTIDALQDKYTRLQMEYQGMCKDKGYLEQSMTALKTKTEGLEDNLTALQKKIEDLEDSTTVLKKKNEQLEAEAVLMNPLEQEPVACQPQNEQVHQIANQVDEAKEELQNTCPQSSVARCHQRFQFFKRSHNTARSRALDEISNLQDEVKALREICDNYKQYLDKATSPKCSPSLYHKLEARPAGH